MKNTQGATFPLSAQPPQPQEPEVGQLAMPHRILVCDEDRIFCESLSRQARQSGFAVTTCFNFSDFWGTFLSQRAVVAAVVLDHALVKEMAKTPFFQRLGGVLVIVTDAGPKVPLRSPRLPFTRGVYLHKHTGVNAVLAAVHTATGYPPVLH